MVFFPVLSSACPGHTASHSPEAVLHMHRPRTHRLRHHRPRHTPTPLPFCFFYLQNPRISFSSPCHSFFLCFSPVQPFRDCLQALHHLRFPLPFLADRFLGFRQSADRCQLFLKTAFGFYPVFRYQNSFEPSLLFFCPFEQVPQPP